MYAKLRGVYRVADLGIVRSQSKRSTGRNHARAL